MVKTGTSIIFVNNENKVLLFLRDNIPSIKYPNQWDILGGGVEENETPEHCVVREMKEEIGIDLHDFRLFEIREFPDRREYTFWKCENFRVEDLILSEGQELRWFSREEIANTELAFGFNVTIERFFEKLPLLTAVHCSS